ncbi:MAG: ABC transporter ATP-binding protein/permease [Eubacteriaceae bacterium]|jgi:ATP-binding cassette subfamily B protein|nr:ABC transporter ATP-binding protein/permease [Eubacteriaceae bacterium]
MENEERAGEQRKLSASVWMKISPYVFRYKGLVALVCLTLALMAGVDVALPLFMRHAVNEFIGAHSLDGIAGFAAAYIALVVFAVLLTAVEAMAAIRIEMLVGRDLKKDCYSRLQVLGLDYYSHNSVGSIISRLFSDTHRIVGVVAWVAADLVWAGMYLIGIVAAMAALNWRLSLTALPAFPAAFFLTALFRGKLLAANREERKANAAIVGAFNEGVSGAKSTKTLVIEQSNASRFEETTSGMYRAVLRSQLLNAAFAPLIAFVSTAAAAAVMVRGGNMALEDLLELGTLSAFLSYCIGMLEPITYASRIVSELISTQAAIERVAELLEEEPGVSDTEEAIALYGDSYSPKTENWEAIEGEIEFRHVSFRYPDGDGDVLEDFSLKIEAGDTVAIVGETGAGKSTIVNLACRFYDPSEGQVLIDGKDARKRSQKWLHSQLGYVLQDPHLFSGTIEDNIRYGKRGASSEEVEKAAQLVGLDKVAQRMPDGYGTEVGEAGNMLSAGERQLVSFARAIVGDPPILILDEATSSVDTEIEAALQKAVMSMTRKRTSIVIAHRLSTIRSSSMILFVEGGRITESGTHESLMGKAGSYAALYAAMGPEAES